jgi:hypothetical protein
VLFRLLRDHFRERRRFKGWQATVQALHVLEDFDVHLYIVRELLVHNKLEVSIKNYFTKVSELDTDVLDDAISKIDEHCSADLLEVRANLIVIKRTVNEVREKSSKISMTSFRAEKMMREGMVVLTTAIDAIREDYDRYYVKA